MPAFLCKGDEVAQYLIERRGYVVIGIYKSTGGRPLGHRIDRFANMPLSQDLVIYAETIEEDWREQGRVALSFKNDPGVPYSQWREPDAYFYRAMTD